MVICAGIIIIAMIKLKNGLRNLQLYTTSPYAVMLEKYTAQRVAPTEMIREFIKPLAGLKLLPSKMAKFFIIYVEGKSEIACC